MLFAEHDSNPGIIAQKYLGYKLLLLQQQQHQDVVEGYTNILTNKSTYPKLGQIADSWIYHMRQN